MIKLRKENEELRGQLKSLNAQLDEVLSRPKRFEGSGDSNSYTARNKVLQSLQLQTSLYEKELEALREKAVTTSLNRKIELEREREELKEGIKQMSAENKRFGRRVKEADEKITSQNMNPEEVVVFQRLNDEYRREKEKLTKTQEAYNHAKQQNENAKEKIQTLAAQEGKLNPPSREVHDPSEDFEPQKIPIDAGDVAKLKKMLEEVEKSKAATEAKDKKRLAEISAQIEQAQGLRNELANKVKDKEKESRIIEHRIKDAKRKIRVLNLKGKISAPDLIGNISEAPSAEPTPSKIDVPKALFPTHTKNVASINSVNSSEFEIKSEVDKHYHFDRPSIDNIPADEFKVDNSSTKGPQLKNHSFDKPKLDFGSKLRSGSRGSSIVRSESRDSNKKKSRSSSINSSEDLEFEMNPSKVGLPMKEMKVKL
jgi:DNA repair exonuclease SbcCD ATPase subunit